MTTKHIILEILAQAKDNKWPFPKTFDELKDNGVLSYNVSWQNGYHSHFILSNNEVVTEEVIGEFKQPIIAKAFSSVNAKKALVKHQKDQTNYVEWIDEMALAGTSHYIVDMQKRLVTYYNLTESDSLVEAVPSYNK